MNKFLITLFSILYLVLSSAFSLLINGTFLYVLWLLIKSNLSLESEVINLWTCILVVQLIEFISFRLDRKSNPNTVKRYKKFKKGLKKRLHHDS